MKKRRGLNDHPVNRKAKHQDLISFGSPKYAKRGLKGSKIIKYI